MGNGEIKNKRVFLEQYRGRKVLITGHTGFKGSWMCRTLLQAGAQVYGYALEAPEDPALFRILSLEKEMASVIGDVRDYEKLFQFMKECRPEIVIHMAAQPIVRESYKRPAYTYETNVVGTVNVLECIRNLESVQSFVNVTTDKVYLNREWDWGYRENEELNGFDPYSNSKSCSELVTASYRQSFFEDRDIAITTMRAGNVIGGGDFAVDRIIPDCVRAAEKEQDILIRNPDSIRPYQHVLEPVLAYLRVAVEQLQNKKLEGAYNIGPQEENCITTGQMADLFCQKWKELSGREQKWVSGSEKGPHEAKLLKLDCAKIKSVFGWKPVWDIRQTMDHVTEWYYGYVNGADMLQITDEQIEKYTKAM